MSTTPPMDLNVDSVETTTWTRELMFSLPRDVSRALLNLLPIPTDQSLSNADPSLRRPSLRSELKKKGVSSLRLRRPRSRVSLILNCMTADPSCSVLHQLHAKRNEKEDCQLCLSSRGTCCKALCRELSVERSSRNSSINLLPSRLRWINLSLANLAKFKNNDGA